MNFFFKDIYKTKDEVCYNHNLVIGKRDGGCFIKMSCGDFKFKVGDNINRMKFEMIVGTE